MLSYVRLNDIISYKKNNRLKKRLKARRCRNFGSICSGNIKKNKNYLGLNKFRLISNLTNKKVIALGGITNKNLKMLNLVNCEGFAGISFFQKKTAPKKGPLN